MARIGTDYQLRLAEWAIPDGQRNAEPGDRRSAALDPVAVQFTNDGLPGHSAAGCRDCVAAPPAAQNLAGQMFYASATLKNTDI